MISQHLKSSSKEHFNRCTNTLTPQYSGDAFSLEKAVILMSKQAMHTPLDNHLKSERDTAAWQSVRGVILCCWQRPIYNLGRTDNAGFTCCGLLKDSVQITAASLDIGSG